MAKRGRQRFRRPRRVLSAINGFVNSFVRTVLNVYFLGISIFASYIFKTPDSLKFLSDAFAKISILKPVSTFIQSYHYKASAIVYFLLLTFFCLPGRLSLAYFIISMIAVYALKQTDDFTEYFVFAILIMWFARTSSPKIRVFIAIVALFLFSYGIWGKQLFA